MWDIEWGHELNKNKDRAQVAKNLNEELEKA